MLNLSNEHSLRGFATQAMTGKAINKTKGRKAALFNTFIIHDYKLYCTANGKIALSVRQPAIEASGCAIGRSLSFSPASHQ